MITSLDNEKVKNVVKMQNKKYRDEVGLFVVEGEHLLKEVYSEGLIKEVFLLEGEELSFDIEYTVVSSLVMRKMSELESIPKVLAVCKKNTNDEIVGDRILLLEDIQDPGNLGTIIRSSVAFNVSSIVLSKKCVDLYNSKVIRATQGMFCHIPVISMDIEDAIKILRDRGVTIYSTNVVNGVDVRTLDKTNRSRFALVMGNEGAGVSRKVQMLCDKNLYIPMDSKVESLNVGVACSIILYELGR